MTFFELEKILKHIRKQDNEFSTCDELRVCIPVEIVGTCGGHPCVDVKDISCGIDWDNGKLFITPEFLLRETTRDELKEIREKFEELANHMRTIRELKKEIKKLKGQ